MKNKIWDTIAKAHEGMKKERMKELETLWDRPRSDARVYPGRTGAVKWLMRNRKGFWLDEKPPEQKRQEELERFFRSPRSNTFKGD